MHHVMRGAGVWCLNDRLDSQRLDPTRPHPAS